jgi:hypothetical protein
MVTGCSAWIDLPVDSVREIVESQDPERTHQILEAHRRRLERQQSLLAARVSDVNRHLEKGMTMAPHKPEGMPRCSAVRDPSGNWIWLYQG